MASDKKVAIVTGSARGIGESTAVMLAERNYNVVVNYASSAGEAKETAEVCERAGAEILLVQGDIAVDADCRCIVDETMVKWGRLDVLVNNAGTTTYVNHTDLEGLTPEVWERTFSVNVFGTFQMVRAAEKALRASGNGCVVNVGSIAGVAGIGSSIAYAASKGAVNTMTLSLARVLAPEVRINTICPGFVGTKWQRDGQGEGYDAYVEQVEKGTPQQHACTADDIADSVVSMVEGHRYMTGETILVDAGSHLGFSPLVAR